MKRTFVLIVIIIILLTILIVREFTRNRPAFTNNFQPAKMHGIGPVEIDPQPVPDTMKPFQPYIYFSDNVSDPAGYDSLTMAIYIPFGYKVVDSPFRGIFLNPVIGKPENNDVRQFKIYVDTSARNPKSIYIKTVMIPHNEDYNTAGSLGLANDYEIDLIDRRNGHYYRQTVVHHAQVFQPVHNR